MKFFVMVYAYRDLELDKTINNLFEMADNPQDITVGCINADDVDYVYNGPHSVKVKNVDYTQYHGCGLACSQILNYFHRKEDYIVKIDPHTRFSKGWDTYYKRFIGEDRVVCSRCLGYHEDGTYDKEETAYSRPIGFHDTQVIELQGTKYEGVEKEVLFFNAGFFIAPAKWKSSVGYDPHIAMWGEETDLSCRTWLEGFKIVNVPAKVYHLYGRKNRKSVDSTEEFEKLNRAGIERTKLKLGLRKPDPELMKSWKRYGCEGKAYKEAIERQIAADAIVLAKDGATIPPVYAPTAVVKCPHCGSKTFYDKGFCRWCYKGLNNSQVLK